MERIHAQPVLLSASARGRGPLIAESLSRSHRDIMINRYVGTCGSCNGNFIFRAVVPLARTDAMRFCCPACGVELSAGLSVDYSIPKMTLQPSGFIIKPWVGEQLPTVVTVATDLPVHREKHVRPLHEGGSPFLLMCEELGPKFLEWKGKVDCLQHLRETSFERVIQLVDHGRAARWNSVRRVLEDLFNEQLPALVTEDAIIYACYRVMSVLYAPLMPVGEAGDILKDYYQYLNDCLSNKTTQYHELLRGWLQGAEFMSFRAKAFTAFGRVLKARC